VLQVRLARLATIELGWPISTGTEKQWINPIVEKQPVVLWFAASNVYFTNERGVPYKRKPLRLEHPDTKVLIGFKAYVVEPLTEYALMWEFYLPLNGPIQGRPIGASRTYERAWLGRRRTRGEWLDCSSWVPNEAIIFATDCL
jgi:hypothetical protein